MNEQRLRKQQQLSPPPPSSSVAGLSAPKSMPARVPQTSQPAAQIQAAQSPSSPTPPPPAAASPPTPSAAAATPLPAAVGSSFPSLSFSLPSPNPNSSPSSTTTASTTSATTTTTTKIPFRPRKIRKVSSSSSQGELKTEPGDQNDRSSISTTTGGGNNNNNNNSRRLVCRVPTRPLSAVGEVAAALRHLRAADPHLARVIDAHEPPIFQSLHPPFHSLTRSILYQQLAFKAAASIYSRFLALCGGEAGVVPETVLALTPHQLRQIGVSARKASYLHDLASKYHGGILSDDSIVAMDDKSLFAMLTMVKGIGAWSVHMFMIFSIHRPDVLPVGDLGVRKGVQLLYGLDALPRPSQMEQLCERWRPYRSVGAWYMWRLIEAKGTPAAIAMSSSGDAETAASGGGGSALVVGAPPLPPLPPLQQQMQHQQHPQQQHQLQPQLIDSIQGIHNLL